MIRFRLMTLMPFGDGRTGNVGVKDSDSVTGFCKCICQGSGHEALSDTALTGHDTDHMLDKTSWILRKLLRTMCFFSMLRAALTA